MADSIFLPSAFLPDASNRPCTTDDIRGKWKPFAKPADPGVTVGVDGSTLERPLSREKHAGGAMVAAEAAVASVGPRNDGHAILFVDCAMPGSAISGIRFEESGPRWIEARATDEQIAKWATEVWTPKDFELFAFAEKLAERRAMEFIMAKNGKDPARPGWPKDSGISLAHAFVSIAACATELDSTFKGFPPFFAVRLCRRDAAPVNPHNIIIASQTDGARAQAQRADELAVMREMLAGQKQLIEQLISEREPKKKSA